MRTIYLVELRTEETEWTPVSAWASVELANRCIELQEQSDSAMALITKFYYRYVEIKLFSYD